jgi:hypothetical protein
MPWIRAARIGVFVALAACGSGSSPQTPEAPADDHSAPRQPELVAVSISSLGLALSVPSAGPPIPEARTMDEGTFLFSEHGVLRATVAAGPEQTLAHRAQSLAASAHGRSEEETARETCGRTASVRAFYVEIVRTIGSNFDDEGHLVHTFPPTNEPFEAHITVELALRNTPVLITWVVPTSERRAYAEAEEAFFASIECVD